MSHATEDALLMNFYISSYQQTEQRIQQMYFTLDVLRENIENLHASRVRQTQTPPPFRRFERNQRERMNRSLFPRETLDTHWIDHFFDNVTVAPTVAQIQRGSRRLLYRDIVEPLNVSCPISLERFEPTTEIIELLHCHHLFHPASLYSWFQTNPRCPVCRHDIREESRQAPETNPQAQETNTRAPETNTRAPETRRVVEDSWIESMLQQFLRDPNIAGQDGIVFDITATRLSPLDISLNATTR
jgi:hypothetical protein